MFSWLAKKPKTTKRTSVRQRFLRTKPQDTLPLKITHERIYILPSKRGWFFIFSLLIMLIASMNYAINLGFALCFLLAGLFAASLLSTYKNLAGIEINAAKGGQAFTNDKLSYQLTFNNLTNAPRFGIKAQTTEKIENNFSIESLGTAIIELAVTAVSRGNRQLGRITVSSDYPLGLWRGWSYFNTSCTGIVYPQIESDSPAVPIQSANVEENKNLHEKPGNDEFSELKSYQPGDPQSRVAWKTVARGQGWYSKAFSDEISTSQLHFSLDDTHELESLEHQLSRLTAWVVHCEKLNSNYSMALPGFQSPQACGSEHQNSLLKKLALYGLPDEQ